MICQNGELRLVDGANEFEGRLELCWNETWGSICDGFWTEFESDVACRQLGYQPFDAIPFYNAHFGPGTGPIWLDDVFCFGSEERLLDCFHPGLTNIDFCDGHNDDVGVRCVEGEKLNILGYVTLLCCSFRLCKWTGATYQWTSDRSGSCRGVCGPTLGHSV